jgi:hypothetical protein
MAHRLGFRRYGIAEPGAASADSIGAASGIRSAAAARAAREIDETVP